MCVFVVCLYIFIFLLFLLLYNHYYYSMNVSVYVCVCLCLCERASEQKENTQHKAVNEPKSKSNAHTRHQDIYNKY
jgi:hypothetical protein